MIVGRGRLEIFVPDMETARDLIAAGEVVIPLRGYQIVTEVDDIKIQARHHSGAIRVELALEMPRPEEVDQDENGRPESGDQDGPRPEEVDDQDDPRPDSGDQNPGPHSWPAAKDAR